VVPLAFLIVVAWFRYPQPPAGNNCVTLRIDLTDFRAAELIAIAKSLSAQPGPKSELH
jgi:hypothetical protein